MRRLRDASEGGGEGPLYTSCCCDLLSTAFRLGLRSRVPAHVLACTAVPPNRSISAHSSRGAAVPLSSPPSKLPAPRGVGLGRDCRSSNAHAHARPACLPRVARPWAHLSPLRLPWLWPPLLFSSARFRLCACDESCVRIPPPPFPARHKHSRTALRNPLCPSWSTITLGLPTLCCSPSTRRPVLGHPTPRPFRRLAHRPPLLGHRPRKPQAGCAPASPADAVGVPRSNVSTMESAPHVGHVSMEGRSASTLLLRS